MGGDGRPKKGEGGDAQPNATRNRPPPQRVFGIGYYGTLARPLHTYKINASPFKHLQNIVHLSSLLLTQMGNTMEKLLLLGPLD